LIKGLKLEPSFQWKL